MSGTGTCISCGGPAEEAHHVAGAVNDEALTVPVCKECHRTAHRDLEEVGVPLGRSPSRTPIDRLIAVLRSLAQHFLNLGERLHAWAEWLASWWHRLREILCPECLERVEAEG